LVKAVLAYSTLVNGMQLEEMVATQVDQEFMGQMVLVGTVDTLQALVQQELLKEDQETVCLELVQAVEELEIQTELDFLMHTLLIILVLAVLVL